MTSEMTDVSMCKKRAHAVSAAIERMRTLCASELNRNTLEQVKAEVEQLAAQTHWWSATQYPAPVLPELQARYLIAEDADHSFALYLNVMRPHYCPVKS